MPLKRRQALQGLAAAAAAAIFPAGVRASVVGAGNEGIPRGPLRASRLTDRLVLLQGAGGNGLAASTSEGVVAVDGGFAERASDLVAGIEAELGASRIAALFNTHWHPERVGLNGRAGRDGARIIAHENTRLWLGTEINRPWDEEPIAPLPEEARPNESFYETGEAVFGSLRVRFGYLLQAHTDGDMYVHFQDDNVLAAGGVITGAGAGWPLIDWWTGGWILGLVDGLDVLIEIADEDTVIVPGEGPLLSRADLKLQRDMYLRVYERLVDLFFQARSPEEAVAANPTREYDELFGRSERFVTLAFQSLWGQLAPNV